MSIALDIHLRKPDKVYHEGVRDHRVSVICYQLHSFRRKVLLVQLL